MQIALASCCCKLSTTLTPATVNFSTVLNVVQSPVRSVDEAKVTGGGRWASFLRTFRSTIILVLLHISSNARPPTDTCRLKA